MNVVEVRAVLLDLAYLDWKFEVGGTSDASWLRVSFKATDSMSGESGVQKGRKWLLSKHMTRNEVVQTALKAVLTAVEHEVRENFTYRGHPIYRPHYDVDALLRLCKEKELDYRNKPALVNA